jgi:hypothetical protein
MTDIAPYPVDEQLHNQVGCLNLVTNAVIVWNTVYIEKVVQQLKKEEQFPGDEEIKHIGLLAMFTLMFTDDITSTLDNVGKKPQRERATPAGFSALTTKIFPLLKLSQRSWVRFKCDRSF